MSKIYVLETGCSGDERIVGLFSTAEKAMAAWHAARPKDVGSQFTYTWKDEGNNNWAFDGRWDDAADITAYELDELGEQEFDVRWDGDLGRGVIFQSPVALGPGRYLVTIEDEEGKAYFYHVDAEGRRGKLIAVAELKPVGRE